MDAINRQAAIEAIDSLYFDTVDDHDRTKERIKRLPSVQPEKRTQERTETHACDLISRQAAIDAVSDCGICIQRIVDLPSVQPEQDAFTKWAKSVADRYRPERKKGKWITCDEPPCDDRNVFIAHGTNSFMSCCIGHYDHDNGQWYEDRNWFAKLLFDGLYWCEMPILPIVEEKEYGKDIDDIL